VADARRVAIILAAGSGERLGADDPKAFVALGGRSLLGWAASAAAGCGAVDALVVVVPAGAEARAAGEVPDGKPVTVVAGGATRQSSCRAAIGALPDGVTAVAVHDAARPFASSELFAAALAGLRDGVDGVVPLLSPVDTVKRVREGAVIATEPREELGLAQTPQAFRLAAFVDAHERAEGDGVDLTDDAAVLERAGYRVVAIPGEPANAKITSPADLARASAAVAEGRRG